MELLWEIEGDIRFFTETDFGWETEFTLSAFQIDFGHTLSFLGRAKWGKNRILEFSDGFLFSCHIIGMMAVNKSGETRVFYDLTVRRDK
jgi:hypothetical protein